MKLAGDVLVIIYAFYKIWSMIEWLPRLSSNIIFCIAKRIKFYCSLGAIEPDKKLQVTWLLLNGSISLGLLVVHWSTSSSRMDTWHVRLPSVISVAFSTWSKIALFSAVLPLLRKMSSVLDCAYVYSPNFLIKNSSHVSFECSL